MSIRFKLNFSLVLFGIFLLNLVSAKASPESFSVDTIKNELTWFDKTDTIQFFSVCGSDGLTYLNPSEAESNGVSSWTEGVCQRYKEVLSIEPSTFWIEEIIFNEVSNVSSSNPIGFSDYTNIVLEVFKNKENELFYKSNAFLKNAESELSVWIDFNKNGLFEESEMFGKEDISSTEGNISFSIPSTIKPFLMTRMRIVCSNPTEYPVDSFIASGEVEDYTIIVIEE